MLYKDRIKYKPHTPALHSLNYLTDMTLAPSEVNTNSACHIECNELKLSHTGVKSMHRLFKAKRTPSRLQSAAYWEQSICYYMCLHDE